MEWRSMMVEQAKEELQILETQHPNRFDYLKAELKSFIFLLQSQDHLLSNSTPTNSTSPTPTSTATTQASSTLKKRKKGSSERGRSNQKMQRADCGGEKVNGRWDRVEAVIERAQACLRKIQHFKTGF